MSGGNARWRWTTDYNCRSIAEKAMSRVKKLFEGSLKLRDYDGQVAETMTYNTFAEQNGRGWYARSVRFACKSGQLHRHSS